MVEMKEGVWLRDINKEEEMEEDGVEAEEKI